MRSKVLSRPCTCCEGETAKWAITLDFPPERTWMPLLASWRRASEDRTCAESPSKTHSMAGNGTGATVPTMRWFSASREGRSDAGTSRRGLTVHTTRPADPAGGSQMLAMPSVPVTAFCKKLSFPSHAERVNPLTGTWPASTLTCRGALHSLPVVVVWLAPPTVVIRRLATTLW